MAPQIRAARFWRRSQTRFGVRHPALLSGRTGALGDRGILLPAPPNASELTRQKIKADKRDHCIADGFELVGPGIDLEPSGAKRVSLN